MDLQHLFQYVYIIVFYINVTIFILITCFQEIALLVSKKLETSALPLPYVLQIHKTTLKSTIQKEYYQFIFVIINLGTGGNNPTGDFTSNFPTQ